MCFVYLLTNKYMWLLDFVIFKACSDIVNSNNLGVTCTSFTNQQATGASFSCNTGYYFENSTTDSVPDSCSCKYCLL